MYENDYGVDQMELEPGAEAGTTADAPQDQEGFHSDPEGAPESDGDKAEEGGEFSEPEGTAGEGAAGEEAAPEEKPRRGKRKKKEDGAEQQEPEQQEPPGDAGDVEEPDVGQDGDGDGDVLPDDDDGEEYGDDGEGGGEPDDDEPPDDEPARNVRRRRQESVLDEYGRAITERQTAAKDGLNVLSAAANRRIVLTGAVGGIENDGNALPRVVFYAGGVKVLIPFSEMGFDLNPDEVDAREAGKNMDAMLGAKIDYVVRRVDTANRIAAASRKDAMLTRQRTILNARSGNGYRIREGMKCTARVVQVNRYEMLVEVYGFQTYIRRDAVSNIWVRDIRDMVRVGEEKPVKLVELERDAETGEVVRMVVSMKEAEQTMETDLHAGNSYTGAISGFSETAYFVKVEGIPVEVRCPIRSNSILETMDLGDMVKVVIRRISDRGAYIGSIRKLIKKAEKSLF